MVSGVLSGLDRLRLRGTVRWLATVRGMMRFLWAVQVRLKDFKMYVCQLTNDIRRTAVQWAQNLGRPQQYLNSTALSKEEIARQIAERDGVREGLIAVLSCVEPCWSYEVGPNAQTKQLELRGGRRRCLHLYFYFLHRQWGFLHLRLQTWFPFTIHVCVNGRERLARQLDAAGIPYVRRDNCLLQVANSAAAQRLLAAQVRSDWSGFLDGLTRQCFPAHLRLVHGEPLRYYWSAEESEWATDVMFRSPAALAKLYPHLIRHGIQTFSSADVLRFLGRKLPTHGGVDGRFQGQVVSDLKQRPEGLCVRHRVNFNSIKMYDKQGSVLRVETTINDARDMKVYRQTEGDSDGPPAWRRLRKGVVDLPRRTQISQAANERYLQALAAVDATTPLGQLADRLCRPVTWQGRRVRGLRPLAEDAALLQAVTRGEFAINGFRNRDLRALLYGADEPPADQRRRQSAKITRQLRLLRAHGLIRKVSRTHRYVLTDRGRITIIAFLTARQADTHKLNQLAA